MHFVATDILNLNVLGCITHARVELRLLTLLLFGLVRPLASHLSRRVRLELLLALCLIQGVSFVKFQGAWLLRVLLH